MVFGLQHFADFIDDAGAGDGNGRLLPCLDSDAGEELMRVQHGVAIALGSRPLESLGTLYVTSRRVIWSSDSDRAKGYAVDFLSLSLHAVSRDPEAYPFPCIYTQIETGDSEEEDSESDSESNGDLELSKVTEMRLVPSDPGQLEDLFDIFCQCAELNPEPRQEGDEENCWFFGDEEMGDAGSESGWESLENPVNPIGYANRDHDLAHRVLEKKQLFEGAVASLHAYWFLANHFTVQFCIVSVAILFAAKNGKLVESLVCPTAMHDSYG